MRRIMIIGLGTIVMTGLLAWGATSFFLTGKGAPVHTAYFKHVEVCLEPFADRLEVSTVFVRPVNPAAVPGGQAAWTGEPEYRMPGSARLYHPLIDGGLNGVWAVHGEFKNTHAFAFGGHPNVEIEGELSGRWWLRGHGLPDVPDYVFPAELIAQTFMREAIDAPCPRPDAAMAMAEAQDAMTRGAMRAETNALAGMAQ